MLKNHYGTPGGHLWNHKNITKTHTHTKGTANGKICRSSPQANTKAVLSRWMPHRPTTTCAVRFGRLDFAYTISPWANCNDSQPQQAFRSHHTHKNQATACRIGGFGQAYQHRTHHSMGSVDQP